MILSGDASITKKDLEKLSSRTGNVIAQVAATIEDGTYDKQLLAEPASSVHSSGSFTYQNGGLSAHELTEAFIAMADGFFLKLQSLAVHGQAAGIKDLLRLHIDRLESLHNQL